MNIRDDVILKEIHEGYLVGGAIRDFLMGKHFFDRDITTKNAESFAKSLAVKLDATLITLDDKNKIYRLILKDKKNYLDISELRGNSIEDDLLQRDFTINAIAYDLQNDKFIDTTNGIKDIENKNLRSINEKNFIDDPLRILRAYRFMSTTGFEIDDNLSLILKKHMNLTNIPAKERIHDELMKLFGGKYCSKTLLKMYNDGILEAIFPFVKEMSQVPPNSHHHLDLIHHVIETVKNIEEIYADSQQAVTEHMDCIDFGGYPRINHLKIAGFLHDIGKYSTWTLEQDGKTIWSICDNTKLPEIKNVKHRFIKHDIVGAKLAAPFLKSLKFSNKQIDYIVEMIKKHIYPSNVVSAPTVDNKVMMRYIRKMGNNVIDNIILAKADRLSAQGPEITVEITNANINSLDRLLKFYLDVKDTLKPLPKLLDGNEIMKLLKIKQSPLLGKIINDLHEAQLNGDITSKEDAIALVKKRSL